MPPEPGLSLAVITHNEADRLRRCIESAAFADECIVVDSGSSDGTVEIARALGCTTFHHPFGGYGPQKQFAVDQCRHDWVLLLDADEHLQPSASAQIKQAISDPPPGAVAFSLQRKNHLHGKWIRHCGWWPDPLIRLVHRRHGRFSDSPVHERWLADGPVGALPCAIEHHSFDNYSDLLQKLQEYSTLGARQLIEEKRRVLPWSPLTHGLWTFFQTYALKLGFLDGFDGFMIALMNAGGAFMKYAKCMESRKYPTVRAHSASTTRS